MLAVSTHFVHDPNISIAAIDVSSFGGSEHELLRAPELLGGTPTIMMYLRGAVRGEKHPPIVFDGFEHSDVIINWIVLHRGRVRTAVVDQNAAIPPDALGKPTP